MKLTNEQIESFQKLWLSEINEKISIEEAEQYATELITLMLLLKQASK